MSQPPPPQPYAGVPYRPPTPPKPRPKKRWFVVGGVLLVLSVIAFVVGSVLAFSAITETDAVVEANHTAVTVQVEPDEERMLYVPENQPPAFCELRDAEGEVLLLDPPTGTVTVSTEGLTWRGVGSFSSPTPEVTLECTGTSAQLVRIGAPFGFETVGRLLLLLGVPLVLGLVGAVILLVTTILWVSRKPAPPMAGPGYDGPPPPR